MSTREVGYRITAEDHASAAFRSVSGSLSSANASLFKFTAGFATASIVYDKVAAALAKPIQALKELVRVGDETAKAARQVGLGSDEFQKYAYAAELGGSSAEGLTKAVRILSQHLYDIAHGSGKEASDAFAEIGVEVRDSGGELRSLDATLGAVADAIAGHKDLIERTAIAQKIFGKAGGELITVFEGGSKGLHDLNVEAERYGAIMSAQFLKRSEEASDAGDRLKFAFRALKIEAIDPLLPSITAAANGLAGFLAHLRGYRTPDQFREELRKMNDEIERTGKLEPLDPSFWQKFIYGYRVAFDAITGRTQAQPLSIHEMAAARVAEISWRMAGVTTGPVEALPRFETEEDRLRRFEQLQARIALLPPLQMPKPPRLVRPPRPELVPYGPRELMEQAREQERINEIAADFLATREKTLEREQALKDLDANIKTEKDLLAVSTAAGAVREGVDQAIVAFSQLGSSAQINLGQIVVGALRQVIGSLIEIEIRAAAARRAIGGVGGGGGLDVGGILRGVFGFLAGGPVGGAIAIGGSVAAGAAGGPAGIPFIGPVPKGAQGRLARNVALDPDYQRAQREARYYAGAAS
ncbi:MAG: phage tail tape measure protein [Elusimicrobia bacterium RBG_16_66_12]|nr:MAG: phage tail tape measure protein [Elusimicrobia bacterium RBG_16_66_12]